MNNIIGDRWWDRDPELIQRQDGICRGCGGAAGATGFCGQCHNDRRRSEQHIDIQARAIQERAIHRVVHKQRR